MKKQISTLLRLSVGLFILLGLIYKIGFSVMIETFKTLSFKFAFIIVILYLFASALGTFNIALLLIPLKRDIPFVRLLKYYLLSWGLGIFIPGKLGELSIVYFLQTEGVSVGEGSAVSLLDKIITLFTLVIISLFALFIHFTWSLLTTFVGLIVFALIFFYVFVLWDKGRAFVRTHFLRKYHYMFRGFSKTVKKLLRYHKRVIILNFVLTVLKWALHATVVLFVFKSFGASTSFLNIFVIGAATALVSLIPISVNGLGVKESAAAFFYSKVGVPPSIVVGTYIIFMILAYFLAIVMAFIFWNDISHLVSTVKNKINKGTNK